MAGWYVILDGVEHGPLSADKVRTAVQKGKINGDTLIRKEGMADPVPASAVKGLIPGSAGADSGTRTRRRARSGGTAARSGGTTARRKKAAAPAAQEAVEEAAQGNDSGPAFDAFAKDEDYIKHIDKHHVTENYYYEAAKAFLFPFSINSIAFLLGYVVLALIYVYAGIFLVNAWIGFEYIFFFLMVWFALYGFAYLQRIGQRSAQGDMKAPVWPELGAMLEEIIGPGVVIFGAWVLLRLPYILVAWSEPAYVPASEGLNPVLSGIDMYLCHAWDLLFRLPQTGIEYIMQAISFMLFPIGMLFILVKGGFMGLNPGPLFKTLFSMLPEYVYCMVLVLVCHVAMMLIYNETAAHFHLNETPSLATMTFDFLPGLKFLEVLTFAALAIIPTGYLLMVQFRIMGLLYFTRSEHFD